jgi:hypothetical protein
MTLEGRLGDALRHVEHVAQVQCEVPARVELAVPLDRGVLRADAQALQLLQRLTDLALAADDAHQVAHDLL